MPQQEIDFAQITEDLVDISSGSYRPSSLDVSNVSAGVTKNTATMNHSKHSCSSLQNLCKDSSWTSNFQRGCMIVRTHEESINKEEYEISKKIYRINLQKRLENQIPADTVNNSGAGTSTLESLSVSFHYSEFKMYPMALGENPPAATGPSLSIDWEPYASHVWNVDDYEEAKEKNSVSRSLQEMRMPADFRTSILREAGFSMSLIIANKRLMNKLRIERAETRRLLYQTSSHERAEKIIRGLKNLILSGKKQEERRFLAMSKEIHDAQQREVDEVARDRRNRKLKSLQDDSILEE